ncbi:MAG: YdeI/OmpD-associated family protein [Bacteroidetes bacterium]|nr:YdeI/OmpD-associated family protein [Bacteroidota bacterium]
MPQLPNPEVDYYLAHGCGRCHLYDTPACKVHPWRPLLEALRALVLETPLVEMRKWGVPCYTYQGANVLNISALKDYAAIGFFKGALLQSETGILESPGPNSQSVRQIRFTALEQVARLAPQVRQLIDQAIDLEKHGKKVDFAAKHALELPAELEDMMAGQPALAQAFHTLSPGRQRGYVLYFSSAKQSATRKARIEKHISNILMGRGIHD